MNAGDWINLFACGSSLIATIIAAAALRDTKKTQQKMEIHQRKQSTILNFQDLQEDVLDKMVSVTDKEIADVIECIEEPQMKEIYDVYRSMIARCEHFAVGVEEGVYDFNTVAALSGKHLIYLYKKFLPVIEKACERGRNSTYYRAFSSMVEKLEKKQ